MKTIFFIRHGLTSGNLKKQYIGRTDEPLCKEGIESAQKHRLSAAALKETITFSNQSGHAPDAFDESAGLPFLLFVSPYLRCVMTAEILFPNHPRITVPDLREMDFGIFEGKSADDLKGDVEYTKWVAGGCTGPVPMGEDVSAFKERCCFAFSSAAKAIPDGGCGIFVIHGGVIMAVMERFALPEKEFYAYHIDNCGVLSCRYERGNLYMNEGTGL